MFLINEMVIRSSKELEKDLLVESLIIMFNLIQNISYIQKLLAY